MHVCVACVRVSVCACVCMCACVRACVHVCVWHVGVVESVHVGVVCEGVHGHVCMLVCGL